MDSAKIAERFFNAVNDQVYSKYDYDVEDYERIYITGPIGAGSSITRYWDGFFYNGTVSECSVSIESVEFMDGETLDYTL
jgi:hypothetical protein